MKIRKNNRDSKISLVEEMILSSGLKDYTSEKGQEELLKLLTYRILEDKIKKNNTFFSYKESNNVYRVLIDSYERALGSLALFCFKKDVPSSIGYLYFVSNPAFSGYYKIGYSRDAETRLIQYQVASPFKDYKIEKYLITRNAKKLEHEVLKSNRSSLMGNEWIETDDIDDVFKNACQVANDLGMYNRFIRTSTKRFFEEINNGTGQFGGYDFKNVIEHTNANLGHTKKKRTLIKHHPISEIKRTSRIFQ